LCGGGGGGEAHHALCGGDEAGTSGALGGDSQTAYPHGTRTFSDEGAGGCRGVISGVTALPCMIVISSR
jgi:hypothetical protein